MWGTASVKDIAAAINGILADVFCGQRFDRPAHRAANGNRESADRFSFIHHIHRMTAQLRPVNNIFDEQFVGQTVRVARSPLARFRFPLTQNLVMTLTSSTSPPPLLPLGRSRHPYHAADEYPTATFRDTPAYVPRHPSICEGSRPYAGRNLGVRVWGDSKVPLATPLFMRI